MIIGYNLDIRIYPTGYKEFQYHWNSLGCLVTCVQLYLAKLLLNLFIDPAMPILGLYPTDIVAKI